MLQISRSGTGFMNDIKHQVDSRALIISPVLVMYSTNDQTVSSKNAQRIADESRTMRFMQFIQLLT